MPRPSNSFTGGSARKRSVKRRSSSGWGKVLLAIFIGMCLTILAAPLYFYFGSPPVGVADRPALWERFTVGMALDRRLARESKPAPFPAGEDAFEGAARTYRSHCAQCHGSPSQDAAIASAMLPHPPQFFLRDRKSTASRSPGALYWATAFGVRRSGMPAYRRSLTNTQMWQLALLLHSADQELPEPVRALMTAPDEPMAAAHSAAR